LAGATQYQPPFFLVMSLLLLLRLYGPRQGVSDLNFDGWKTCSSDAVLLESKLKSELQEEELKITLSPNRENLLAKQPQSSITFLLSPSLRYQDDQVS